MTYRNPFLIQQVKSQCLQHTDSPIVCSTSADSYNKMSAASGNGVSDDFPNPVGRCIQRISFGFGKECNSGSSGHFDDCSFASIQNAVTAKYRFFKRSGYAYLCACAATAKRQSVHRAFATVCKWANGDICIRIYAPDSGRGTFPGFEGSHASFKRIDGNNNVHVYSPPDI